MLNKILKVCKERLDVTKFSAAIEMAMAREEADLHNSKSNAQRLRDALKLLLAFKRDLGASLSDETIALLQRLIKQSNSPVCKQLAQQCLND